MKRKHTENTKLTQTGSSSVKVD